MERRHLINLALLLIVSILGLLVWQTMENQPGETEHPSLTQLKPEQIQRISITNRSGQTFTLERPVQDWHMTAPYQVAADNTRIERLLEIASTPSLERFPLPAGRLDEFGLAPPTAEMQLNQTRLVLGGTHPYSFRRYIRIGDTLHLINDRFPHYFQAQPEDFISRRLFDGSHKLSEISTPRWRLHKGSQGWQLDPPRAGLSIDRLVHKAAAWKNALASAIETAPEGSVDGSVSIRFASSSAQVVFDLINGEQTTLLRNRETGIAYRLGSVEELLEAPQVNKD